ncbi:hypothetical protein GCM10026983_01360 [Gracilibacillus alcaliphilus]
MMSQLICKFTSAAVPVSFIDWVRERPNMLAFVILGILITSYYTRNKLKKRVKEAARHKY